MRKGIFALIAVAILFFQTGLLDLNSQARQAKEKETTLQHEVTVTLKLVQTYVTDKQGNPVIDLTQSDFELYDNGKLEKITDFEKHILTLTLPEEKAKEIAAPSQIQPKLNRKFFLLFDFLRNDSPGIKRSKKAAVHFIETQLMPTDEVAVLSYSQFKGLILHEYLTLDHRKAKEAVERIKEIPTLGGDLDEGLSMEPRSIIQKETASERAEYAPRGGSERADEIELINKFNIIMKEFAQSLRYIPGFKNIIFFSSGITKSMLYDMAMNAEEAEGSVILSTYEDMVKELAASNSPVYAVDTEGTRAHFKSQEERGTFALKRLSELSGGKYFYDVENYENIAQTIQNITSNYYVLGYYIDENWDGKFHEIKVKVKRPGCEVLAQGGYFNPKPFTEYSEFEKQLHLYDLALAEKPQFQERLEFPLVALQCSGGKEANCVLISEIPVERIKEVIDQKSEIIRFVFDSQKRIVDFKRGEVNIASLSTKKICLYSIASLAPGDYECRLIIRNLTTGKAAVGNAAIKIPEPQTSGLLLFPPLLLIPEREVYYLKGSEANKKESEELSLKNIYPYISTNSFPIIEELEPGISKILAVARCAALNIPAPNLSMSASLFEKTAKQEIPLTHSILSGQIKGETGIFFIEITLPELQAGDYTLNLIITETKTQLKSQATRNLKIR